jgi:Rrf2 family protein
LNNLIVMNFVTIKNFYIFAPEMNNTRFATALHIMTILGKEPNEWLTSDWLAGSINVNPVMVRKEISVLREVGLVECRKGKEGGCRLTKNSEEITIAEIYLAVKNSEVLGKKNQNPNPKCEIGKKINQNLDYLFQETEEIVVSFLEKKTLKSFMEKFQ